MINPTHSKHWKKLKKLSESKSSIGLISNDNGVSIDFSKSRLGADIWGALSDLTLTQDVDGWRQKMFAGDVINTTENRAVWHVALRSGKNTDALNVLNQMKLFVESTHANNKFTDIVHIGIGGSDLGPKLVCEGLKHLPTKMNVHFVSNVDGADIEETLKYLSPKTTLFVIASKTFTTQETMMNATYAKKWLGDLPVSDHVIALSTNENAVKEFGIDTDKMFPFWDWVGGRFSVWSAIGMPIALTYGMDVFQEFLNGAKIMDDHFYSKPFEENMPILLAMSGVWNRNFMDRSALAVLPYAQNLSRLSDFLQQLDMESNGKSVNREGEFITDYKTGPVVFGQAGTNGQHAFHQWLHQGSDIVPCEFIVVEKSKYDRVHQNVLNANANAQSLALLEGLKNDNNHHKNYDGKRPCVTIKLDDLSPQKIGQLIALYEHKIFVQGIVWNINSFDQFGVELGKELAKQILAK